MNAFKREVIVPVVETEQEVKDRAAKMLEMFLPDKKRRSKTISDSVFARVRVGVERMIKSGDWSDATPRDFVALYAMLHNRVYGVEPEDLTSSTRLYAASLAHKLLDRSFGGDQGEFAGFIRWVWIREEGREKWRRQNNVSGGRISWRLQFNGALVADWRIDRVRAPVSQTRIKT